MPLRFTIRDLLWLTLVVALCAAWWIDRARFAARLEADARRMAELQLERFAVMQSISGKIPLISTTPPPEHPDVLVHDPLR